MPAACRPGGKPVVSSGTVIRVVSTSLRGWRASSLAALTLVLALLSGLQPHLQAAEQAATAAAPYDLEADEALGGHTLERHVGRSDSDLADRLRREPQISAASTYTDATTAKRVVGAAIARSRDRIQSWVGRGGGSRPNLVLNYSEPGGAAIGRSLGRRSRNSVPATRALVVLRWLPREQRWIVLTSYPEAR
jgi:hypothetical protein